MQLAHSIATTNCPACADLERLRARNEAALRHAHKSYIAALRAADFVSLPDLEEELKQTTASRKIIGYTLRVHQERQHVHQVAA